MGAIWFELLATLDALPPYNPGQSGHRTNSALGQYSLGCAVQSLCLVDLVSSEMDTPRRGEFFGKSRHGTGVLDVRHYDQYLGR